VLEDFDFEADIQPANSAAQWIAAKLYAGSNEEIWRKEFLKRFAIIDDRSFQFLVRHATEVQAHVAIDHTLGTVNREEGALWYQESLPAETVLVSIARLDGKRGDEKSALTAITAQTYLQVGGKATTGQGLVRMVAVGG
jgi:CRISPR-associated protein Cmr4